MGKQFSSLSPAHQEFIQDQKIFFVGTAANEGRVNISPKGMDSFHIVNEHKVVWLNLTGSGNETAAHLLKHNRMTIMFCAFEGNPMILRLYGTAKTHHPRDKAFQQYIHLFPANPGSRQIFELEIDMVQASCGYSVPLMNYQEDRTILTDWATQKGEEKIQEYWEQKNTQSIDGFDTKIVKE